MAIGGMTLGYLLFSILHFFQFALAITVCALYGVELDRARKAGVHAEGKWASLQAARVPRHLFD